MKLLLNVDQTEALRHGIDAPSSTVHLEINPADLTEVEREYIASHLISGHDLTRSSLRLNDPSFAGLRAELSRVVEEKKEDERRRAGRILERDRVLAEHMNAKPVRRETFRFTADGSLTTWQSDTVVTIEVDLPVVRGFSTSDASPDMGARYAAYEIACEAERKSIIEAQLPEVRRLLAERRAAKAVIDAEYAALYAHLPAALRARAEAGYAKNSEVTEAIEDMIREEAGFTSERDFESQCAAKVLTDDEFVALTAIKERAPEGAVVDACEVWSKGDSDDEDDDDGYSSRCRVARVKWSHAGLTVTAYASLDSGSDS